MKLQAWIPLFCGLLTPAAVLHVHAQDASPPSAAGADAHALEDEPAARAAADAPPPTAAERRTTPQAADSERAPSFPAPVLHAPILQWHEVTSSRPVKSGQRHTAVLTAGFLTLVTSLITTELVLNFMLQPFDTDDGCHADCQANKRAAFPLVGPFMAIAMPEMHKHDDVYALFGASQALGFVGLVAGAILFAQDPNKPSEAVKSDRFLLSAAPTRDGAQLAMRVSL